MESFQYRVHDALEEQCPNLLPLVYMLDISAFGEQHQATTTSCCGCL